MRFSLGIAAGTVTLAIALPVRLPKSVRRAVKDGKRVSVRLKLTARTATGAESTGTAKLAKVRKPPWKKRHSAPSR